MQVTFLLLLTGYSSKQQTSSLMLNFGDLEEMGSFSDLNEKHLKDIRWYKNVIEHQKKEKEKVTLYYKLSLMKQPTLNKMFLALKVGSFKMLLIHE